MRLDWKQLKSLSVETNSGTKLGKVCDLVLETAGQLVAQYVVKPTLLSSKKYLINQDQVIKFTEDKMVVEDGVMKRLTESDKVAKPAVGPEPAMMRKE